MENKPKKKIYEKGYFWLLLLAIGFIIWWQTTLVFEKRLNNKYIGETKAITESLDGEIAKDLKDNTHKLDYKKISDKLNSYFTRYEDLSQQAYNLKTEIIENEAKLTEELKEDKDSKTLDNYLNRNNQLKDEFIKLYKDFSLIKDETDLEGENLESIDEIVNLAKLGCAYRIRGKEITDLNLNKWREDLHIKTIQESKVEQQLANGQIKKAKYKKLDLDNLLLK